MGFSFSIILHPTSSARVGFLNSDWMTRYSEVRLRGVKTMSFWNSVAREPNLKPEGDLNRFVLAFEVFALAKL